MMLGRLVIGTLCALVGSAVPTPATAQEDVPVAIWMSAGIGAGSLGSFAGHLSGNVHRNRTRVAMRVTGNDGRGQYETFLGSMGDEFFDLALLIGRGGHTRQGHLSVSLGPSRVTGARAVRSTGGWGGGTLEPIDPTFGLAAEMDWSRHLARAVGAGLVIYGNLNPAQSFLGAVGGVRVGRLR